LDHSNIKKIKELIQKGNNKNIGLKDYIDFNEIFKDLEKKE